MNQSTFYKLVLKALYIIMMTQKGYNMGQMYAKWNVEYELVMKGEL
jgi:hypothetical protein